ncbi:MAG: MFS transporter, partial [Stellaceae bacterium]
RRVCETMPMIAARASVDRPAGALALLAGRRFGGLFWAQALSAFNDNAVKNALVLMIAFDPDAGSRLSAQILVPLAGGIFMLPFFLCSAGAGRLADEHDKAWLVRLIKLSEIPLMLVAAAGVLAGSTTVLLVLLGAMGVEAALFGPLKYAILPDLLAPHELLLGNALVEAGTFLAILFGTIAGALIAGHHGAAVVAALIVAVACAAWGASLAIPPTGAAAARGRGARWNIFADTARVIREAARRKTPFRAMLGISWFWLAGAVYLSQFPGYVRFYLGGEEAVVTLLLTVFSVGIAAGSLACSRILAGRISARTVPWGALGIGLFSIDLWLASPAAAAGAALTGLGAFLASPAHWRILADLFGISASAGIFIVPLYALLQAASPREERARAIAANNVINAAAMVLSAAAVIALAAAGVTIPGLFLLTGVATIAVGFLFWRMLPGFAAAPLRLDKAQG